MVEDLERSKRDHVIVSREDGVIRIEADDEDVQVRIDLLRAERLTTEPEEDDIPEGLEGVYYL